jgi:eukaryotic-like serine/threonine-protein kinase
MPLAAGARLGPYDVVAPLGAGGMGEVYRAQDSRLGREVALKVLPAGVASDPARQQRFETEARAVAALNHPNIVAIYDVALQEQPAFIVSELVPGETLRGVIQRGPVPLKKVLDIAVQVADGLAAAHAAGIAHRDLKPENIMLTAGGASKNSGLRPGEIHFPRGRARGRDPYHRRHRAGHDCRNRILYES